MIVYKKAVLERFEGKVAILVLENGQELRILKADLAESATKGSPFVVQIAPEEEANLEREALARTLLNQILADDSLPAEEAKNEY